jgi:hypothetical protein
MMLLSESEEAGRVEEDVERGGEGEKGAGWGVVRPASAVGRTLEIQAPPPPDLGRNRRRPGRVEGKGGKVPDGDADRRREA